MNRLVPMTLTLTLAGIAVAAPPPAPPPGSARLLSAPGEEVLHPRLDPTTGIVTYEVVEEGRRAVRQVALGNGGPRPVGTETMRDVVPARLGRPVGNRLGPDGRWSVTVAGQEPCSASAASDMHPALSPDGRLVAFASGRSGRGDIIVADAVKHSQSGRRASQDPSPEASPVFAPDGKKLAFLRFGPKGRSIVMATGFDGKGSASERVVADERDGALSVSFRPDGKTLAYYGRDWTVGTSLFVTDVDGSAGRRLFSDVKAQRAGPAWLAQPGGAVVVAVRQDDQIVLIADDGSDTLVTTESVGNTEVTAGTVRGQRWIVFTALGLEKDESKDLRRLKLYAIQLQ